MVKFLLGLWGGFVFAVVVVTHLIATREYLETPALIKSQSFEYQDVHYKIVPVAKKDWVEYKN